MTFQKVSASVSAKLALFTWYWIDTKIPHYRLSPGSRSNRQLCSINGWARAAKQELTHARASHTVAFAGSAEQTSNSATVKMCVRVSVQACTVERHGLLGEKKQLCADALMSTKRLPCCGTVLQSSEDRRAEISSCLSCRVQEQSWKSDNVPCQH